MAYIRNIGGGRGLGQGSTRSAFTSRPIISRSGSSPAGAAKERFFTKAVDRVKRAKEANTKGRLVLSDETYRKASTALDRNKAYKTRKRGGYPAEYQGSDVSRTGKVRGHYWTSKNPTGGPDIQYRVGPKGESK